MRNPYNWATILATADAKENAGDKEEEQKRGSDEQPEMLRVDEVTGENQEAPKQQGEESDEEFTYNGTTINR